jgi:hypothetical protein
MVLSCSPSWMLVDVKKDMAPNLMRFGAMSELRSVNHSHDDNVVLTLFVQLGRNDVRDN